MSVVHTLPAYREGLPHVTEGYFCWCEPVISAMCLMCHGAKAGCFNCDRGWIQYKAGDIRLQGHPSVNVVHNDR